MQIKTIVPKSHWVVFSRISEVTNLRDWRGLDKVHPYTSQSNSLSPSAEPLSYVRSAVSLWHRLAYVYKWQLLPTQITLRYSSHFPVSFSSSDSSNSSSSIASYSPLICLVSLYSSVYYFSSSWLCPFAASNAMSLANSIILPIILTVKQLYIGWWPRKQCQMSAQISNRLIGQVSFIGQHMWRVIQMTQLTSTKDSWLMYLNLSSTGPFSHPHVLEM